MQVQEVLEGNQAWWQVPGLAQANPEESQTIETPVVPTQGQMFSLTYNVPKND